MIERQEWVRANHDHLRRVLMLEPRGHPDMCGALLTEPEHPDSDAGVLFMHNQGFAPMSGHGVIAVTTIALERGLLLPRSARSDKTPRAARTHIVLDTPVGSVHATARMTGSRVSSVSFRNVPSFVLHGGVPVRLGARELRADVAFGGAFYAIVDSEAAGLPLISDRLPDLRSAAMEIKRGVETAVRVEHPEGLAQPGIDGTIFTGPPSSDLADLRSVMVFAGTQINRSPSGTGTCAIMAVLSAMGLLGEGQTFTHESIIGTTFRGRVVRKEIVGEWPAVVAEIEGEACITAECTFLVDERDPLALGFRL